MPEEYVHKLSAKTETSEWCFYKPTVGNLEHVIYDCCHEGPSNQKTGITQALTEGTDKV